MTRNQCQSDMSPSTEQSLSVAFLSSLLSPAHLQKQQQKQKKQQQQKQQQQQHAPHSPVYSQHARAPESLQQHPTTLQHHIQLCLMQQVSPPHFTPPSPSTVILPQHQFQFIDEYEPLQRKSPLLSQLSPPPTPPHPLPLEKQLPLRSYASPSPPHRSISSPTPSLPQILSFQALPCQSLSQYSHVVKAFPSACLSDHGLRTEVHQAPLFMRQVKIKSVDEASRSGKRKISFAEVKNNGERRMIIV